MSSRVRSRSFKVFRVLPALALGAAAVGVITAATSAGGTPASLAAATCPGWATYQAPDANTAGWNLLAGVTVTSASNAWATSLYQGGTGILHWDGRSWAFQSTSAGTHDELGGILATSATNAWAAGRQYSASGHKYLNLILHWNGKSWQSQAVPSPGLGNDLGGLAATSATNAWAAGSYTGASPHSQTQILHWNGHTWARQATPDPGTVNSIGGIAATSASNAWAVGYMSDGLASQTFILHWNGHAWARQASPNPSGNVHNIRLYSVTAASASSAWAVGSYYDYAVSTSATQALILHWNGSSWSRVAGTGAGELTAVKAFSPSNAWAVGDYINGSGQVRELTMHWDGSAWSAQPGPNPSDTYSYLEGIAGVSASDIWVVGRTGNSNFTARYC